MERVSIPLKEAEVIGLQKVTETDFKETLLLYSQCLSSKYLYIS